MTELTDFITKYRWEDIFTVWYVLIDDAYVLLHTHFGRWRRRGPIPLFSDSEVITIALIADTFFAGDEEKTLSFVRQYHLPMFPYLPSPGRFNHRRRTLVLIIEQVRKVLTEQWGLLEDWEGEHTTTRITDSAPIPVCTYTRAKVNRTIQQTGQPRELYFGVSASRKAKVFGFRLHLDCSTDQVIDNWLLAPASMHDSRGMSGLHQREEVAGLMLLGDGSFNNPGWLASIRHNHRVGGETVRVWALPRADTRKPWPEEFRAFIARVRRRIETALSVLCTVFNLEHPRSRSLTGLVGRVATRMLAYTLCFVTGYLLHLLGFQPITQN